MGAVTAALLVPATLEELRPDAFLRLPVEGVVLAALLTVLPRRLVAPTAAGAGVVLALLTLVKAANAAVEPSLGRPLDLVSDLPSLGSGAGVLADALSVPVEVVLAGAAVVAVLVVVALVAAVRALAAVLREHRPSALRVLAALAAAWLVLAAARTPFASAGTTGFAAGVVGRAVASASADRTFSTALRSTDPVSSSSGLAAGPLRGKDVLVLFVESYGEVAVHRSSIAGAVDAALAEDTRRLAAAGWSARSAMLTSPTFGGVSWLAHGTLQSGLWVPDQQSYDRLLSSRRLTLTRAFGEAGWRTVSDVPSDRGAWPEGRRFYGFDRMLDATNVGYRGPRFGYARIPDQWTLAHLAATELGPGHAPVMAEVDLVSSHTPWTPLPRLVDPAALGDGSVFDPMPAKGLAAEVAWRRPETVRALYGRSIRYSVDAVTRFVAAAHERDLVVLMVGDHQPARIVSGDGASHDVPVSLIASDPAVLSAVTTWHWSAGLRPSDTRPVWRMDALRDRFLGAFDRE
ncbi:CDP-alcohol phosphatidyltransferase [Amnibacterium sp. CER49]|uniref:CDP-alcohol phosphatidyltransferase n=1 Tax=Amnibacterium sp. CER49 TaxID=3039161 RepID=UPI00244910C6|nr:CDP-alcohol phosphatidyltransferase [Amnibacterium sp. CER49]MDH2443764.1 CDP-alcohol phosphatidyltransferase [Amnibacterium sp. CER49]